MRNYCHYCGKWNGAHATLPGQPTDHLCKCPHDAARQSQAPAQAGTDDYERAIRDAASRVRDTLVIAGESAEAMREAIAGRVEALLPRPNETRGQTAKPDPLSELDANATSGVRGPIVAAQAGTVEGLRKNALKEIGDMAQMATWEDRHRLDLIRRCVEGLAALASREAQPAPPSSGLDETADARDAARQPGWQIAGHAALIHYPECWDTAAYPTLDSAVREVLACSGCSVCKDAARALSGGEGV